MVANWSLRKSKLRAISFQLHLWSGLIVGLWSLVIGLTGFALVYRPELEQGGAKISTAAPVRPASLEVLANALQKEAGGVPLESVKLQTTSGAIDFHYKMTAEKQDAQQADHGNGKRLADFHLLADPASGRIVGRTERHSGMLGWLRDLHFDLLAGKTGRKVNGALAGVMLLLCVTGLIVWWPGVKNWMSRLWISRGKSWKRTNWDAHNAVGFWFAGAIAVQSITGIFFAWPHLVKGPEVKQPYTIAGQAQQRPNLDMLLASAEAAAPQGRITHIKFKKKPDEAIEVRYKTAGDWREEGNNRLWLSPLDGSVVAHDQWAEMPLARKIEMAYGPVHFGRFLGVGWPSLLVRVFYLFIGLAPAFLFLSGVLMYWNRSLSKKWAKWKLARPKLRPATISHSQAALLLLILTSPLFAQLRSLEGMVTDQSAAAIVGARVQLGSDIRREAFTDAQGRFRLPFPEALATKISIEAPGFEPAVLEVKPGAELKIVLKPAAQATSVTVNAGTLDQLRLDEPVPMTSLGREDIASRNNRRLSDVVARMPGVYMTGPAGGDKDVRLRGLDKEFTRTQVDGVMIPDAGEKRELQLNRIPSFMVEKVTIVRNPSAEYESDGAAGRVDVQTRPIPPGFRMDGRAGMGFREDLNRRVYNGQLSMGYRRGMFGFFGAFDHLQDPLAIVKDRRNSNGTAEIEDEQQLQRTPNFFGDFGIFTDRFGDFHLKPVLMRFSTGVSKSRENLNAVGNPTALNIEGESKAALTRGLSFTHNRAANSGLLWNSQVGYFLTEEDKLDKFRQAYSFQGGNRVLGTLLTEPETKADKTWNVQSALAVPWRLGFANELKFGLSLRGRDRFRDKQRIERLANGIVRDVTDPKDTYLLDEKYQGYFIQNRFRITERLSLLPGLRLEQVDLQTATPQERSAPRRFTDWNPSASILYRLRDNWTVRAAVSRGLNRPKFDELSPFEVEQPTRFIFGNPDLNPTRLWSYDVGSEFATGKLTLAINGFRKTIRGVIEQVDTGRFLFGKNVLQVMNVGNGWISGIEFEQRLRMPSAAPPWLRAFSVWANQTHLNSNLRDFLGNNRRFKEQPYWLSNKGIDYVEERTGTSLSLMANFVSARDELKLNMDTVRIGQSASFDLAVYQRLRGRYRLFFEGNNLTNRQRLVDENMVNGSGIRRIETYGRTAILGVQFSI